MDMKYIQYKNKSSDELFDIVLEIVDKMENVYKQYELRKIDSTEYNHQLSVLRGILVLLGSGVIDPILLILDEDKYHNSVREILVQALGELKDPRAVEKLTSIFLKEHNVRGSYASDRNEIKKSAAEALGKIGTPEAVEILFNFLKNDIKNADDQDTASYGIAALGTMAIAPLNEIIETSNDTNDARMILDFIKRIYKID